MNDTLRTLLKLGILMALASQVGTCARQIPDTGRRVQAAAQEAEHDSPTCDPGTMTVYDMPSTEEWSDFRRGGVWREKAWTNARAILTKAENQLCHLTALAPMLRANGQPVRFAVDTGFWGSERLWDSERNLIQFADIAGGDSFIQEVRSLLATTACVGVMSPAVRCDTSTGLLLTCWSDGRLIDSSRAHLVLGDHLPACYASMAACIAEIRSGDSRLLRRWWLVIDD